MLYIDFNYTKSCFKFQLSNLDSFHAMAKTIPHFSNNSHIQQCVFYHILLLFQNTDNDLVYLDKIIREHLKCDKCSLPLKSPFIECAGGHIVCSKCLDPTKCPVCLGKFTMSCKLAEKLLTLLPKPCQYSNLGCSNVSVSGRHEPVCQFRAINCMMRTNGPCSWGGTLKEWKEHVAAIHKDHIAEYSPYLDKAIWFKECAFDENWNELCIYLEARKKVFLFIMKKCGDKIHFAVRYIPLKNYNSEFYILLCGTQNSNDHFHHSTTVFKFAVKAKALVEGETLEYVICKFYGAFVSEVSKRPVNIRFDLVKDAK